MRPLVPSFAVALTDARPAWCLLVAALAACNAPVPLRAALEPAPTATALPVASPKLGLVEEDAGPPLASMSAETPIPLEHPFEQVPLPSNTPELVAVAGRDERDVWLLTVSQPPGFVGKEQKDALFLHWDGARVAREKGPSCRPWSEYSGLVLLPDAVLVLGIYYGDGYTGRMEARRSARGGWSCESRGSTDSGSGQIVALGTALLRFDRSLTLSGRRLPFPEDDMAKLCCLEMAARSPEDLWVYQRDQGAAIFHGNGVVWESRPTGLTRISSLRVDDSGGAWLVGANEGESKGEGGVVLRWDPAAHAWSRVPTPADFRAQRVRVSSGRAVWLIGNEHIHHWDGKTLRRGKTPLGSVNGAWMSGSGELWLVGGDQPNRGDGTPVVGLAFRAPPQGKTP